MLISARTDDGRKVTFRHDEIRDWYGNICLDHGYALTIASAQGLTVDRTFLLADARPARETIYPAATRHRDGLDIYVNRVPLALDVADRRADNDIDAPVTDVEIRAYLAGRWSRSQPKEAALDYMADGVWQDRQADGEDRQRAAGAGREAAPGTRLAANDNALARIARDIRRTTFGWRYGQVVAAFAAGRREVLAAYDNLRERTRSEGDAVALGGAFRETGPDGLNRSVQHMEEPAVALAHGDACAVAEPAPIAEVQPDELSVPSLKGAQEDDPPRQIEAVSRNHARGKRNAWRMRSGRSQLTGRDGRAPR